MKSALMVLMIAGVLFVAGCVGQTPQGSQQTQDEKPRENAVLVAHNSFNPRQLTISKGEAVIWKNTVSFQGLPYDKHTITSGKIDSTCSQGKPGVIQNTGCGVADGKFAGVANGGTYSFTFNEAGTYMYYIAEHPTLAGLGTIVVTGQSSSSGVKEFKVQAPHAGYTFYFEGRPVVKVSANKGDRIRFLAVSDIPSHNHGIAIDEFGVNEAVLTEDENAPKVIEFTADKAGTFKIYCKTCLTGTFGPHPWMEATLDVK